MVPVILLLVFVHLAEVIVKFYFFYNFLGNLWFQSAFVPVVEEGYQHCQGESGNKPFLDTSELEVIQTDDTNSVLNGNLKILVNIVQPFQVSSKYWRNNLVELRHTLAGFLDIFASFSRFGLSDQCSDPSFK
jgi:hypothetical protein